MNILTKYNVADMDTHGTDCIRPAEEEVVVQMRMPEEDPKIAGLFIWREFFSEDAALSIAKHVAALDGWAGVSDGPKSRRVIHNGYKYDYRKMALPVKTIAIPEILAGLAGLVAPTILGESKTFDQLIINEYTPGQGIASHVDHPHQFGDVVFCVSLGAGTTIVFTHPDGRVSPRWMPAGSAYAMTGESRHTWRHGIEAKKCDYVGSSRVPRGIRYSLTYRTIRFPRE